MDFPYDESPMTIDWFALNAIEWSPTEQPRSFHEPEPAVLIPAVTISSSPLVTQGDHPLTYILEVIAAIWY